MTLDAIKKSILSEAEEKSSAIDSDAERESAQLVKEADEKAKGIMKSAEQEATKEADRIRKEGEAGAEIESRSIIFSARGRAVERALKKVMSKVQSDVKNENMLKVFNSGLKQFKEISGHDDIIVKTNKKNASLLKGKDFEVEYGDIDGFMFYTSDRKIALNATVDSIVNDQQDLARKLIADELFGESKSAPKKVTMKVKAKKPKGKKKR